MAARTLQPSEYEIQREVEALRDIRRRSTTPGALTIDPDLPNQSPTTSPTSRVWPSGPPKSPRRSNSNSSTSSNDRSSSDRSSHGAPSAESDNAEQTSASSTDDPFHLFWVPASVHPEIAPAEFRAFLKEHARAIPPDGAELGRSVSSSSTSSLGRKRSMLRRQYQPRENDGVEEEKVVSLSRNRSYLYNNPVQLTFQDLQRLEQLAEEASESDDSSKLRTMLRRSLSLNLSPSAIDRMDNVPEMGDEADAPIIVPPPGQILRRAARTKIRKPGLPGDGGGHRFGSTRRGAARAVTLPPTTDQRNSSDFSSSDHGDTSTEIDLVQQRRKTFSDDGFSGQRPESFSEEASSIFDAYVRDEEDEHFINPSLVITSPPPQSAYSTDLPPSQQEVPQLPLPDAQPALLDALGPILHQPQPQLLLQPQPSLEYQQPSRTPSPSSAEGSSSHGGQSDIQTPSSGQQQQIAPTIEEQAQQPVPSSYPPEIYQPQPPAPPQQPRKDKKGLFGKWGSDKSSKKSKDKESKERPEKEKEKETGFFGSLFGSKKKQDADFAPSVVGGNAGREAAQALLGASKSSKNYVPPSSPGLAPGANPYARYPIHVERAIYRLSHIKLANPRRPLYEQVLISNLMFWYLGVINKAQNPTPAAQTQPNGAAGSGVEHSGEGTQPSAEEVEREQREREQREQEQRERERAEKERAEREKELEATRKKESGKRGLTKSPAGVAGGRRAEMPVRGPQYEMQHRVMEQEYGSFNMQSNQQMGRVSANGSQPHPRQHLEQQYYDNQQQPQRLPPGAMAPVDQTSSWMSQNNGQRPRNPSPQRSRTPPQNHMSPQPVQRQASSLPQDGFVGAGVGGRPSRSLSANAVHVPQAQTNGPGSKIRKGSSAHAVSPSSQPQMRRPLSSEGQPGVDSDGIGGEEEDMPLAALRQQQRRVV